jgi:hypothetical protein
MTIGAALVIIAILYLIDKHNLWKRSAAVCLIILAITLLGFAGYYGWQRWQERKAQAKAEADLESQWEVVSEEPNWNIPDPPKGFVPESVSEAILYPLKIADKVKTDAWVWYRDSSCVIVGDPATSPTHVLHKNDLFRFDSFDARWMRDIALPQEVKRGLWNAKVAECGLQPGQKNVKACLDRATGTVDVGPDPEKFAQYLTSCGPNMEMIYLKSGTEQKK